MESNDQATSSGRSPPMWPQFQKSCFWMFLRWRWLPLAISELFSIAVQILSEFRFQCPFGNSHLICRPPSQHSQEPSFSFYTLFFSYQCWTIIGLWLQWKQVLVHLLERLCLLLLAPARRQKMLGATAVQIWRILNCWSYSIVSNSLFCPFQHSIFVALKFWSKDSTL